MVWNTPFKIRSKTLPCLVLRDFSIFMEPLVGHLASVVRDPFLHYDMNFHQPELDQEFISVAHNLYLRIA
jgi:hypothetical protein